MLLADGSVKAIERVALGDVVVTTDPDTGTVEQHKVVGTIVHSDEDARTQVTVDSDGASGPVIATSWHPVWVEEAGGFVAIGAVQVGEHLHSPNGPGPVVTAVRHFTQTAPVYDLTVDDVHTYYVNAGVRPILVHNCAAKSSSGGRAEGPILTKSQSTDVAEMLGYSATKFKSAGRGAAKIYQNKKASAAERFITQDMTGHAGGLFKVGPTIESLQTTSSSLRSGSYGIDFTRVAGAMLRWIRP